MVKTVKITTDNKISVVQLPSWSLDDQEKEIRANCTETVKTQLMCDFFRTYRGIPVMIVDESGLVNDRPINQVASFLYGGGSPIAGDVIFGIQKGPDILPPGEPEGMMYQLLMSFPCLHEEQSGNPRGGGRA